MHRANAVRLMRKAAKEFDKALDADSGDTFIDVYAERENVHQVLRSIDPNWAKAFAVALSR
jgi:hypothetical protein